MAVNSQNISALVPGKGKARAQPTREVVDERVLRLLGIESFEVEMDYDTYKDALRRVMIESRMGGSKLPSEEAEAVTNEWRRVKGRKGRFIAKKKVIKAKDIQRAGATSGLSRKAITGAAVGVPAGLLAAAATAPPAGGGGVLKAIQDSLDNIIKVLKEQNKLDRKAIEKDRKQKLRTRRDRLKEGLKGGAKAVANTAKKVIKPVQNILGDIMGVLLKLLFGKALLKLLKWFSDPANDTKKAALFKFFNDFWPMMTAAVVAFGTAVGPMIAGLVKTIGGFVVNLVTKIIPGLIGAAAGLAKSLGLKGLAMGAGAAWLGNKLLNPTEAANQTSPDPDPDPVSPGSPTQSGTSLDPETPQEERVEETGNRPTDPKKINPVDVLNKNRHLLPKIPLMDVYQTALDRINEDPSAYDTKEEIEAALSRYNIDPRKVQYATGGFVSGPGGVDRVSAKLTAGEFVMSKGAVDKWGTNTLAAMNAAGGGTNNPSFGRYNTGGPVKPKSTQEKPREQDDKGGGLWGWARGLMGFGTDDKPVEDGKSNDSSGSGGSIKGFTGQDFRDLAYIVSSEAARDTDDEYGVAASILNRVADPAWPNTIKAVGSQGGQYEAVYKGKAHDDPALAKKLASAEGQAKIVEAMKILKGRTDFKGQSELKNRASTDPMFHSRGNFFHYKEQVAKSDPAPSPLPSYYNKFIGSGGPSVALDGTHSPSIVASKGGTTAPGQQPGKTGTGDSATGSGYARAISDAEIDALIASEFGGAQQRGSNRPPQTKFSPVAKATPPSPPSHSLQSIGDAIKRGDTKGVDSTVHTIPESSANIGTQLPQFDVSSHAVQIARSSTVLGINA